MSSQQTDESRVADTGDQPDEIRRSDEREPSPNRVEEIAKLLLGAAGLVVLAGLLSIIPPLERAVPGTPDGVFVTFETVVSGLVTVVVVGLFLVIADELEALVVERLPGRDPLVEDAGAVVKYLVVFLVLVAAYGPLADVAAPFLAPSDTVWLFDLAYVLVTLLPLAVAASLVVGNLDELASLLVGAFRSASERVESGPSTTTGDQSPEVHDDTDADGTLDDAHEDGTDPAEPGAEDPVEAGPGREE